MAIAFRPRSNASAISSRYGSQALALGARLGGRPGSVDTPADIAGFGCPPRFLSNRSRNPSGSITMNWRTPIISSLTRYHQRLSQLNDAGVDVALEECGKAEFALRAICPTCFSELLRDRQRFTP